MARRIQLDLACGALLLGVACAAAAQPAIKDGLWEVTTTMDMSGAPAGRPPQTMQHCVTPQEAKDPANIGRNMDKSGQCQMVDHKVSGNTATWKLVCKGEGAMTGTGTATYAGTTYTMTSTTTMTQGTQTMTMQVNQTGKYIGPCKQ